MALNKFIVLVIGGPCLVGKSLLSDCEADCLGLGIHRSSFLPLDLFPVNSFSTHGSRPLLGESAASWTSVQSAEALAVKPRRQS